MKKARYLLLFMCFAMLLQSSGGDVTEDVAYSGETV